jgi:hypothetical protein|tara:strand:+ start:1448 stop:2161 length:714 start_codon:yes stop_codon:yes gene_type:complete
MKLKALEIDFTDQIKARSLEKMTYVKTPEVFLKTARSDFKHLNIDVTELLNFPPPKNESEETKKELDEIKKFMKLDHPKDFKSNLKKMDEDPAQFVIDHYEKIANKKAPESVLKFITSGDVEVLAMKLKMHYNRPRPYQIAEHYNIDFNYNKSIQNGAANHPSYPSGHTLSAYFTARVLGYIDPQVKKELIQKAKMVADSRIMEGVHFKSDNDFAIYLVDNVLMPAFLKEYDKGKNT